MSTETDEFEQITMQGKAHFANIKLALLPTESDPPFAKSKAFKTLVESIRTMGVLNPVTLRLDNEQYVVIAGRRRIAAAREAGLKTIPAMVYSEDVHEAFIPAAGVAENAVRSTNLSADIENVSALMAQNYSAASIAQLTGMRLHDVVRVMDTLALPSEIVQGVRDGTIARTTAEALQKSTPDVIASTLDVYREHGKLTAQDVRVARSVGFAESTATLDLPELPALGPTLREQIIAVLDAKGTTTFKLAEIERIVRPAHKNGAREA